MKDIQTYVKEAALPPIYKRNNKDCFLDPIRQKLIYITPEETLRQKLISWLLDVIKVPRQMLSVEDRLSHYGLSTKDRADIIIWEQTDAEHSAPLVVIECKADSVYLDEKAHNQVFRYSDALGSKYSLLTNGNEYYCYKYDEHTNSYIRITELPAYAEMLKGKCKELNFGEIPDRIPFEKLESEMQLIRKDFEDGIFTDISGDTPMNLAVPMLNFEEGILDVRSKMKCKDYGLFRLIDDYGVRMLTYGNGSGGTFYGPYRSFLVEINGSTEFFSIGLSTYGNSDPEKNLCSKTCICVAHDDGEHAHHALQLVVEDNLIVEEDVIRFFHHGRIAIGRIGSGKKAELMELVEEKYPQIISGNRFYLGSLKNDHAFRLEDNDMTDLVVNLISYSIIRDFYRDEVKSRKGGSKR